MPRLCSVSLTRVMAGSCRQRGRDIGVDIGAEVAALSASADWAAELTRARDAALAYPAYYTQPFHAYPEGNLCWQAALEARAQRRAPLPAPACSPGRGGSLASQGSLWQARWTADGAPPDARCRRLSPGRQAPLCCIKLRSPAKQARSMSAEGGHEGKLISPTISWLSQAHA